jgi:hypothetical protein
VTTHPQGSLGSDDLIGGQIVRAPCRREGQGAYRLEPEMSLLGGDPDVIAISVDARLYIYQPHPWMADNLDDDKGMSVSRR